MDNIRPYALINGCNGRWLFVKKIGASGNLAPTIDLFVFKTNVA